MGDKDNTRRHDESKHISEPSWTVSKVGAITGEASDPVAQTLHRGQGHQNILCASITLKLNRSAKVIESEGGYNADERRTCVRDKKGNQ